MRCILATSALVVAVFWSVAAAADDTQPDWVRRPTSATMEASWPREALSKGIGGRVMLECVVTVQGTLRDCKVASEDPPNMSFGAAALAMTPQFLFKPATHDDKPVESSVSIPITFPTPQGLAAGDTPPDWVRRPTSETLKAVWPRDALKKGVGGRVAITCLVTVQGTLRDCQVISEDPPNMSFGAAVVAMTPQFLFKPATHDGKPIESTITIPIAFQGRTTPPESGAAARPAPITGTRIPDAQASGASTQPSLAEEPTVAKVQWVAAPSFADVAAAYPDKARSEKVGGHAALNCRFARDGHLAACDVVSESPAGYGFGAAARRLAKDFAAAVDAKGPSPAGISTELSVTFAPEMLEGRPLALARPQWTHLPEMLDVAQAFPAAATAAHVATGHVTMTCTVGAAGKLTDCAVARQDPEGLGFGAAALAVAPLFQLSLWTDEGLPTVGEQVTVPMRYDAPSPPASAPPSTPAP